LDLLHGWTTGIRIVRQDFSALADDFTELMLQINQWRWEIVSGVLKKKKKKLYQLIPHKNLED
jgi:hypothetical protein